MKKNNKGFTLVECVVAIAVVSIVSIASIVIYRISINSTRRQWDNYMSTISANNALSCFQNAENLTDFLENGTKIDLKSFNNKTSKNNIDVPMFYKDLDLSELQLKPQAFTKVRRFDSGKVIFYNGDTRLITFKYAEDNLSTFVEDAKDLDEGLINLDYETKDDKYSIGGEGSSYGEIKSINYTTYIKGKEDNYGLTTWKDDNNQRPALTIDYYRDSSDNLKVKISGKLQTGYTTKTTAKNGASITNGIATLEYDATDFEKYLLKKSYVLRCVGIKTKSGNLIDATFEVYTARSDKSLKRATDSNGKEIYYKVCNIDGNFNTGIQPVQSADMRDHWFWFAYAGKGSSKKVTVQVSYGNTDSFTNLVDGDYNFGNAFTFYYSTIFCRFDGGNSQKFTINSIDSTASYSSESLTISGFVDPNGNKVTMTINDTFVSFKDDKGNIRTSVATELDKYLMQNKYFLSPVKTVKNDPGYIVWCKVYSYSSNPPTPVVNSSNQQLYYALTVRWDSERLANANIATNNWYDLNANYVDLHISAVRYNYGSMPSIGTIDKQYVRADFSCENGNRCNLTAPNFLGLSFATAEKSTNGTDVINVKDVVYKEAVEGDHYYDYGLNNHFSASIFYALANNGEILVYGVFDGSNVPILLYKYNGGYIADAMNDIKTNCKFTKEITTSDAEHKGASYTDNLYAYAANGINYTQYCNLTPGSRLDVTYAKIYKDGSKTIISFRNSNDYAILDFECDDDSDAKQITEGIFKKFYTNVSGTDKYNLTFNGSQLKGKALLSRKVENGIDYYIISILKDDDENKRITVFKTKASTTITFRNHYDIDLVTFIGKSSNSDGQSETQSFYIMPRGDKSKYFVYIQATYANLVNSEYEPIIKIWILPKSKFSNTMAVPSSEPYITYRKG